MIHGAFLFFFVALLVIVWYYDFCPHCRRHALSRVDVGMRCERCGWFER